MRRSRAAAPTVVGRLGPVMGRPPGSPGSPGSLGLGLGLGLVGVSMVMVVASDWLLGQVLVLV